MKTLFVLGACVVAMAAVGCSQEPTQDEASSTESDLSTSFGADDAIRCSVDSADTVLAIVRTQNGKASLISLEPVKGDLFAMSRTSGSITMNRGISVQGTKSSLTLGSSLKGTWKHGSASSDVKCEKVASAEAASWRAANALQDYAGEIDGIASSVLEESNDPMPNDYTVYVVATSKRSSLSLGTVASGTAGSMKKGSEDEDSLLDENDFSYGAMSAAYSLGGGDDYGEWFQGVSDGVSLMGDLGPALGNATAGFIAHEKVTALSSLVGGKPSAVEITVGPWTFFLPDSFPQ